MILLLRMEDVGLRELDAGFGQVDADIGRLRVAEEVVQRHGCHDLPVDLEVPVQHFRLDDAGDMECPRLLLHPAEGLDAPFHFIEHECLRLNVAFGCRLALVLIDNVQDFALAPGLEYRLENIVEDKAEDFIFSLTELTFYDIMILAQKSSLF